MCACGAKTRRCQRREDAEMSYGLMRSCRSASPRFNDSIDSRRMRWFASDQKGSSAAFDLEFTGERTTRSMPSLRVGLPKFRTRPVRNPVIFRYVRHCALNTGSRAVANALHSTTTASLTSKSIRFGWLGSPMSTPLYVTLTGTWRLHSRPLRPSSTARAASYTSSFSPGPRTLCTSIAAPIMASVNSFSGIWSSMMILAFPYGDIIPKILRAFAAPFTPRLSAAGTESKLGVDPNAEVAEARRRRDDFNGVKP